jgi:hypothetical protein
MIEASVVVNELTEFSGLCMEIRFSIFPTIPPHIQKGT